MQLAPLDKRRREPVEIARKRYALRRILDPIYEWKSHNSLPSALGNALRGTKYEYMTLEGIENHMQELIDAWRDEHRSEDYRTLRRITVERAIDILSPITERVVRQMKRIYAFEKDMQSIGAGSLGDDYDPYLARLERQLAAAKSQLDQCEKVWQTGKGLDMKKITSRLQQARGEYADAKARIAAYRQTSARR